MTYVPHHERDEVTAAQLAVEPEVEESKLTHTTFNLQAYPEGPDVLELERSFCPTILPLFHGSR